MVRFTVYAILLNFGTFFAFKGNCGFSPVLEGPSGVRHLIYVPILSFGMAFWAHATSVESADRPVHADSPTQVAPSDAAARPAFSPTKSKTEAIYYEVQKNWLDGWSQDHPDLDGRVSEIYATKKELINALAQANDLPQYTDMWVGINLQMECESLKAKGLLGSQGHPSTQAEKGVETPSNARPGPVFDRAEKTPLQKLLDEWKLTGSLKEIKKVIPDENCVDIYCADCSRPRQKFYEYLKMKTFMNEKALDWSEPRHLDEMLEALKPKR